MHPIILSPLTGSPNTDQIGSIRSSDILTIYQDEYGYDISKYFAGIDEVKVMLCRDSGFMFYHPFILEGDEDYYATMSQFEWYYHPQRWEHTIALDMIHGKDKVLEVGSGAGFFIKRLLDKEIDARGLELNSRAVEIAKESGSDLRNELVQAHAGSHANEYDVVCSFQVLEHIAEPLPFLKSKVDCLKYGGKLIIGVPNNDSYIFDNKMPNRVLNMPPHHMGLWTLKSIEALQGVLGLTLREVHYEPLVDGNVAVYLWNKVNNAFLGIRFFSRVVWKLKIDRLLTPILVRFSHRIRGGSMVAVFTRD